MNNGPPERKQKVLTPQPFLRHYAVCLKQKRRWYYKSLRISVRWKEQHNMGDQKFDMEAYRAVMLTT
jgi:hypothetical protein